MTPSHPIQALSAFLWKEDQRLLVGKLAIKDRRIWFSYDPGFVDLGIGLSPFKLDLELGLKSSNDPVFEGIFGLFNDSLPDGWGRLLLDRHIQNLGGDFRRLSPLDRLAHVGDQGMGALAYEPDFADNAAEDGIVDLDQLSQKAHTVLTGSASDVLAELLRLNASSQGARPKVMLGVNREFSVLSSSPVLDSKQFAPWIIKFAARDDPPDIGRVEYAYALMARTCGLDMPETRLFETFAGAYFGVKRFDRRGKTRYHVHSLSGLLHADHRIPSLDYDLLLRVAQRLTKQRVEVEKAFRLACFNVLAKNRDDHAKNFAFVMTNLNEWVLSPAYDLTLSSGPNGEHSTTVLGEGREPGISNLMDLGQAFNIKTAAEIIDEVRSGIAQWRHFALEAGLTPARVKEIDIILQNPR